jgi:hypothetical protein
MRAACGHYNKRERRNDERERVCRGGGRSAAGSLKRLLTMVGGERARRDESGGQPRLWYTRMRWTPMNEVT